MFERTEGSVPAALVGNVARPRHMLDAILKRKVFHQVQRALDFIDRILAPQSLGIGNRKRRAAFPRRTRFARGGRVNRMERKITSREPRSEFALAFLRAVIEMPPRAKQFNRGSSRALRLFYQVGREFPIHEKIGGENAMHGHRVRAQFPEVVLTLCEAWRRVKADPAYAYSEANEDLRQEIKVVRAEF